MGALDELPLVTRHRITVTDYYRMAEVGLLAPDARVELIDGEVVDMAPIGSQHASVVARLAQQAMQLVGQRAVVWSQNPLRLDELTEPEPDLMLLAPRTDFYASAHPGPADVLLLIEVSHTSARYDREIKLPLYARHGVQEVWMVDLYAACVRFFRKPEGGQYTDITASETPGHVAVAALPGVAIDLTGVLG